MKLKKNELDIKRKKKIQFSGNDFTYTQQPNATFRNADYHVYF